MSDRRRALVTGGAGFIGSEVVGQLAGAGWEVTVLDDLSTGRWSNLDGVPPAMLRAVTGDVRDAALLARLLPGIDTVFHLACRGVRFSLHSPVETHEVNASGTLAVLDAARRANVRRLVHVSSSEVYGCSPGMPLDEDAATLPTTAYGASKLAGEAYARAWHHSHGLAVAIVRPFNAYGPRSHHEGDAGEVIPKFILRALAGQALTVFGDGTQTRDFCHVADTARGIRLAATLDRAVGETVNLGSGHDISIRALAETICAAVGNPDAHLRFDAPRPGDLPCLRADTAKAERLLGFRPEFPFATGLARLIDDYRRAPDGAVRLLRDDVLRNWERGDG